MDFRKKLQAGLADVFLEFVGRIAGQGAQDYPDLTVLVVDCSSDDDPTARVAAVLPRAFVRRVDTGKGGFATAANESLSMVEGAPFLLFCHDDVRLAPDAVRLLVEEAFRSNAGIVGPKLVDWAESNIGETLSFYRLPRAHHKHLKSTNMLERLNEEIKRRTRVVRIFPNTESCLRLIRALCVETHETWLEDNRYLNMALLAEQKKEQLRLAA